MASSPARSILATGSTASHNELGGRLRTGEFAHIGDAAGEANLLQNNGRLTPGGASKVMTTELLGNWAQGGSGEYSVDLDLFETDADGNEIQAKPPTA